VSKLLLIGGDDVSNDVIAIVTCFTLVSRQGATGKLGGGIQIQETEFQVLLLFPAPPTERSN